MKLGNRTLVLFFTILIVLSGLSIAFRIPTDPQGSTDKITVMTYNIHMFYVEDDDAPETKTGNFIFDGIIDVIQEVDPDIIGLQESEGNRLTSANINGILWLAHQLDMYFYYGPQTGDQIYGVSILSKWPIAEEETLMYPVEESIERVAVKVKIDHPVQDFYVVSTHLQTSKYEIDRYNMATSLIDFVGDGDTIILGDFNTRPYPSDQTYMLLNSTFNSAWVYAGNHINATEGLTSPASEPRSKIDYIWFTPDNWNVIPGSALVLGSRDNSDHCALYAEFEFA